MRFQRGLAGVAVDQVAVASPRGAVSQLARTVVVLRGVAIRRPSTGPGEPARSRRGTCLSEASAPGIAHRWRWRRLALLARLQSPPHRRVPGLHPRRQPQQLVPGSGRGRKRRRQPGRPGTRQRSSRTRKRSDDAGRMRSGRRPSPAQRRRSRWLRPSPAGRHRCPKAARRSPCRVPRHRHRRTPTRTASRGTTRLMAGG